MYRKTYVKIDESALYENVRNITENYPEYKYYFGVVKGNAYGHGMHVVNALIKGGANYLAVATLEEAEKVRKYNSETPILCLEPIDLEYIEEVLRLNVTLTVDSLAYFNKLNSLPLEKELRVHIKLDTGMNRLGIKDKQEVDTLFATEKQPNIIIEGIYTHLATSGINDPYYDIQLEKFKELTADIDLSLIPIVHIGRSLILVHHKKADFVNGVRLGICMYGFSQSLPEPTGLRKIKRDFICKLKGISPAILSNSLKLKTAFSLYSTVLSVKQIKKGEFVGYGANFKADCDMTVATIAIGYYDGMKKKFKYVMLNSKRCEILGDLCMDMTAIKVPENTRVGDTVEIFGDEISIRLAARNSSSSAYRVLTDITCRVPRIYGEEEIYL